MFYGLPRQMLYLCEFHPDEELVLLNLAGLAVSCSRNLAGLLKYHANAANRALTGSSDNRRPNMEFIEQDHLNLHHHHTYHNHPA